MHVVYDAFVFQFILESKVSMEGLDLKVIESPSSNKRNLEKFESENDTELDFSRNAKR